MFVLVLVLSFLRPSSSYGYELFVGEILVAIKGVSEVPPLIRTLVPLIIRIPLFFFKKNHLPHAHHIILGELPLSCSENYISSLIVQMRMSFALLRQQLFYELIFTFFREKS